MINISHAFLMLVLLQVISKTPCHSEGAPLRDRKVSYFRHCERSLRSNLLLGKQFYP